MGIFVRLTLKEKLFLLNSLSKLFKKEKISTSPIIKNYIFYDEKIRLND